MKQARGFTLMEVMIALTILSMMMVAIVSSLRTFANTSIVVDRKTDRVDEIRMVSGLIRRSLEAAILSGGTSSVPTFDRVDEAGTYFSGATSELTWVAAMVGGSSFSGVFFMRLSFEGEQLMLRWQPYVSGTVPADWDSVKARVLLQDVEGYNVSYRSVYGSDWLEDWSDTLNNPVSVKMTIMVDGKYWPELIVRLG